jgi:hypothetical protein
MWPMHSFFVGIDSEPHELVKDSGQSGGLDGLKHRSTTGQAQVKQKILQLKPIDRWEYSSPYPVGPVRVVVRIPKRLSELFQTI